VQHTAGRFGGPEVRSPSGVSERSAAAPPNGTQRDSSGAPRPGDTTARAVALLAIAVLAIAPYVQFLGNGFVGSDSLPLIETSRLSGLADGMTAFTRPVMAGTSFVAGELVYRPFVTLTFGLDYAVWGLNAAGYHATNLALHVIGAVLIWLILTQLGLKWWSSLIGAGVFAVHPLVVVSVPVIARRDSLVPVTAFLGAWLLLLAAERASRPLERRAALGGSYLLATVALFSKESAYVAIALLPFLLVLEARACGADWRRAVGNWKLAVPYFGIAIAAFAVRLLVLGRLGGDRDPGQAVGSPWQVLGAYTRDLIWSLSWAATSTHVVWLMLAGALLVGFALACIALPDRHAALALMGLLWIVAVGAFATLFRIATVAWLAYFALPGVAILWAAGLEGALLVVRRGPAWRASAWTFVLSLGLLLVLGVAGASWLANSALFRRYDQWQIAGDVMGQYTQALDSCIDAAPGLSRLDLEGVPSEFDDGRPDTGQLGVTLFQEYTIQAALRLLQPQRDLGFTMGSHQTLHGPGANLQLTCSADDSRILLTAKSAS
jgi:hypothetical protein